MNRGRIWRASLARFGRPADEVRSGQRSGDAPVRSACVTRRRIARARRVGRAGRPRRSCASAPLVTRGGRDRASRGHPRLTRSDGAVGRCSRSAGLVEGIRHMAWSRIRVSRVGDRLLTVPGVDPARQVLANPSCAPDGSLVLCFGTIDAEQGQPQTVCDRIFAIREVMPSGPPSLSMSSLGRSERRGFSSSVAPGGPIPPELEIETVMSYPPVLPQCKNYLGAGAACARDSSGRYYALLPVTDADVNHAWMTWAASTDGKDWWFLPHTKDPLTSFPLIAHADLGECF